MSDTRTPAERAREQAQRANSTDAERLAALATEYERLAANAERMKKALDDHKPLKKGGRP